MLVRLFLTPIGNILKRNNALKCTVLKSRVSEKNKKLDKIFFEKKLLSLAEKLLSLDPSHFEQDELLNVL